mmetsp:Transcript_32697/g.97364  ORF Transcript_32697/g.97364 Transcript_32697/m.97364 type:complete len:309 (-) Transcript_32697:266-1192(-)
MLRDSAVMPETFATVLSACMSFSTSPRSLLCISQLGHRGSWTTQVRHPREAKRSTPSSASQWQLWASWAASGTLHTVSCHRHPRAMRACGLQWRGQLRSSHQPRSRPFCGARRRQRHSPLPLRNLVLEDMLVRLHQHRRKKAEAAMWRRRPLDAEQIPGRGCRGPMSMRGTLHLPIGLAPRPTYGRRRPTRRGESEPGRRPSGWRRARWPKAQTLLRRTLLLRLAAHLLVRRRLTCPRHQQLRRQPLPSPEDGRRRPLPLLLHRVLRSQQSGRKSPWRPFPLRRRRLLRRPQPPLPTLLMARGSCGRG